MCRDCLYLQWGVRTQWIGLLEWITGLIFSDLKFSLNTGNLAVIYYIAMRRIVHVCVSN